MLSHDEFVKNMAEAARRGEDLFVILSVGADHLLDCQICQKNIAQIVETVFVEEEREEDSEIDPTDLSPEDIEPLLKFPSFDLGFLPGTLESPETAAQQTEQSRVRKLIAGLSKAESPDWSKTSKAVTEIGHLPKGVEHPSSVPPSAESGVPQSPAVEVVASAQSADSSTAQFSQERIASNAVAQMIKDAVTLEESGNLAEAQATYEIARKQVQLDNALREELDSKIRELRHRIRVENRLDHAARAAETMEKDGRWQEAEETYRRLVMETTTQRRREEWARAQKRCQVEREIADLFDSGLRAYKTKDLIGAMNRLKRVIHRRPGYVRNGIAAKTILAQARKEWAGRVAQVSKRGSRRFRLILSGGLVLIILLVVGIWHSAVPNLGPTEAVLDAATLTLVSPDATPSQPVASPNIVSPARTAIPRVTQMVTPNPPAQMGTAVLPRTTTPTSVSPRPTP